MDSKQTSNQLARQLDSIRKKKVLKFKQKITSGKYLVNNKAVALSLFMSR